MWDFQISTLNLIEEMEFFEINTRQGRSNYYVTFSGFNLAKYIVEDYIENKEIAYGEAEEEFLWMTVPKNVALENITSDVNRAKVKDLISEGRVVNPIFKKVISTLRDG